MTGGHRPASGKLGAPPVVGKEGGASRRMALTADEQIHLAAADLAVRLNGTALRSPNFIRTVKAFESYIRTGRFDLSAVD